eukprot:TRINITY_DN189_c0_g5_i1.p1 TRINITY_DN189_c0_g5~~TRINITY_DN189_c0_g5_i1.p1  ORF type:complete len:135 (+),score=19.76 TRINITY_DN189_c0_g5_i1:581-985(+)
MYRILAKLLSMQKSISDGFSSLRACPQTWAKVAGVSGCLAIALGAYAAHSKTLSADGRDMMNRANKYHLIHSVALIALSATNKHPLSACLITVGTLLFSGSLYLKGLYGIATMYIPPVGGVMMMVGWLSIAFLK